MTIRRHILPGSLASTRGHSSIRQRAYPVVVGRHSLDSDALVSDGYMPRPLHVPIRRIDRNVESDYLTSTVDHAAYKSHSIVDDVNSIASVSRARDNQLLQSCNAALVRSQTPMSTKAMVAHRRVTGSAPAGGYRKVELRSSSFDKARKPTSSPKNATGRAASLMREADIAVEQYYDASAAIRKPIEEAKKILLTRQNLAANPGYSTRVKVRHQNVGTKPASTSQKVTPLPYQAPPSSRSYKTKAALIAGKVDVDRKPRRPKSEYASDKYRQINLGRAKAYEPLEIGRSAAPPGGGSGDNVSSVRQKLRKTLAMSKNDPSYYD